jgi:ABC-type Co2+ transport system permease subunit
MAAQAPVMIIEVVITLFISLFLKKVRPEMLEGIYA